MESHYVGTGTADVVQVDHRYVFAQGPTPWTQLKFSDPVRQSCRASTHIMDNLDLVYVKYRLQEQ